MTRVRPETGRKPHKSHSRRPKLVVATVAIVCTPRLARLVSDASRFALGSVHSTLLRVAIRAYLLSLVARTIMSVTSSTGATVGSRLSTATPSATIKASTLSPDREPSTSYQPQEPQQPRPSLKRKAHE